MSTVRSSFCDRREGYTDKAVVIRFVLSAGTAILNCWTMNNSDLDVYIYKVYEDALQLNG
jgi:hypothetical protein